MLTLLPSGLRTRVVERGEGHPLLLLHGFTGSADTWAELQDALAPELRTVALDLPGHGQADAPPPGYDLHRLAGDLAGLMAARGHARFGVLGYSMGGRVALHVALAAPGRLSCLVLLSCTPGIEDPGERAARLRDDEALAERIEREGIEAFVDHWEALPLFATLRRLPEAARARLRAQRLAQRPAGLAAALRAFGTGRQEPLWSRLGELHLPVLLMAGAEDARYAAIAGAMARRIPGAELLVLDGCGHAVHLERPDAVREAVRAFVQRHVTTLRR